MTVETLIWMLLALVALDLLAMWFGVDSRRWTDPSYAPWPGF
jgi:hypothetical protein